MRPSKRASSLAWVARHWHQIPWGQRGNRPLRARKRGQRQKVRNGIWPQLAPIGYLNDKAARTIHPDPQRSQLVRKAFELYATGDYTLDALCDAMRELGLISRDGDPLSRAQFHRMLRNPIYAGVIEYKGERYPGRHEPIVSQQTFDAAQRAMLRKSKPKSPAVKPYLYRGLFRCGECGRLVTAETQKGHVYLRCTKWKVACSQPYAREELVSRQVSDALLSMSLPESLADELVADFQQEAKSAREDAKGRTASLRAEEKALDEKLERLMGAYLDKAISLDEYRSAKNNLVTEKQSLASKIASDEENAASPFEPAIAFLKAAKHAGFAAMGENDALKRDLFKKAASNLILKDKRLAYEPRGPWQLIAGQGVSDANEGAAPLAGAAPGSLPAYAGLKRRR